MKHWGILAAVTAVLLVTGCSSSQHPTYADTASSSAGNPQMVAGGVLRVHGGDTWTGELSVQQMSGFDAPVALPHCGRASAGAHRNYFNLNWRPLGHRGKTPAVRLSITTPEGLPVTAATINGTCARISDHHVNRLATGEQYLLWLVAPATAHLHQLQISLDGATTVLPLVRACGPQAQTSTLTCTVDPVTFTPGAPFSRRLAVS